MRHFLANIATYSIAVLLVGGAALFAWMRSAQVMLSDERTLLARYEPVQGHEFDWAELGSRSYASNCRNCHGGEGQGWDEYPSLGHTPRLFAAPGGRDYLVDVHLYGLTSRRWGAPMPPMGHMHDVELAAVINHVLVSFGNEARLPAAPRLYTPGDIAARRGQRLTPAAVNRARPSIP